MTEAESASGEGGRDFIRDIVRADVRAGRQKAVVTRFPPEPNGYLHIGHAKSMCLNFGVAEEFVIAAKTITIDNEQLNPDHEGPPTQRPGNLLRDVGGFTANRHMPRRRRSRA